MSEIIKKNRILFGFLFVILIGMGVLAYFLLQTHGEMQRYINETERIKNNIKDLISKKPAPVEENYIKINKDTKLYTEKLGQVRHFFGEPFRGALDKFCQDLGVNMETFEKEFRDYWKAEIKSGSTRNQAIRKFKIKYQQKKNWDVAWKTFTEEMRKRTSITVDENNIDDFFLLTLGASRKMSPERCVLFCQAMRMAMIGLFEERKISLPPAAADFTFGDQKSVASGQVPNVVINWIIIDDFISRRLVNSGIKSMESFTKTNLEGFPEDDYIRYRYHVQVKGSLASIRSLVNNLVKAYSDNMVYVVRYVSLTKVRDDANMIILHGSSYTPDLDNKSEEEIKRLEEEKAKKREAMREQIKKEWAAAEEKKRREDRRSRRRVVPRKEELKAGEFEAQAKKLEEVVDKRLAEEEKRLAEEEAKKPFYLKKGYGKPIIGASDLFYATIDFDFIRYTGVDLNL